MPAPQIARAKLIPMNGDQVETDESKHIDVQFNPATLRVTLSNTLKADNRAGSGGSGVSEISGVFASAATCAIASADGTPVEPIIASTLSSATNFRAFLAALSGLDSSSSMM